MADCRLIGDGSCRAVRAGRGRQLVDTKNPHNDPKCLTPECMHLHPDRKNYRLRECFVICLAS